MKKKMYLCTIHINNYKNEKPMETKQNNNYITVAYELYTDTQEGHPELVEKATAEHPFQFISGMGVTLDAFEAIIAPLAKGEKFDFTLPVADAYGEYMQEHVLELDKNIFCVNGRFDKEYIYPGNVIPLMNDDGNRFSGTVVEVKDNTVVVDLNHPLAGKALHFVGEVIESRPATTDEIQGQVNRMNGGCGCGCESCGGHCEDGCDDDCGCGHCH